jgi:hypothetical protein
MTPRDRGRRITSQVIRPGPEATHDSDWEDSTVEERIEAVWGLTLLCLAWGGSDGEPRLQRSISRVQRPRG